MICGHFSNFLGSTGPSWPLSVTDCDGSRSSSPFLDWVDRVFILFHSSGDKEHGEACISLYKENFSYTQLVFIAATIY